MNSDDVDRVLIDENVFDEKDIVNSNLPKLMFAISIEDGVNPYLAYEYSESSKLHDIGKIIMLPIIKKESYLTQQEYSIVQQHTIEGFRIAQKRGLKIASQMALCHHENYDGSGYPYKITGKDIPYFCRILKVADVFDALRTKRSYKSKFSLEKTIDILTKGDNRVQPEHFDQRILKMFIEKIELFDSIYD